MFVTSLIPLEVQGASAAACTNGDIGRCGGGDGGGSCGGDGVVGVNLFGCAITRPRLVTFLVFI